MGEEQLEKEESESKNDSGLGGGVGGGTGAHRLSDSYAISRRSGRLRLQYLPSSMQ